MCKFLLIFFLTLASVSSVYAGTPIEQKIECPIGGKSFSITSTASCSSFGDGRHMSFWVPSSCDFVTRLPVCSRYKFPVYKEFSDDEKKRLKTHVKSKEYRALRKQSRYFRAFMVDRFLSPERNVGELFSLLLEGFWYDSAALTYESDTYMRSFLDSGRALSILENEENYYAQAITAYFLYRADQTDEAQSVLANVKKSDAINEEDLLRDYVEAIEQCINKRRVACSPASRLKLEEQE